jgi:hypothetical protein
MKTGEFDSLPKLSDNCDMTTHAQQEVAIFSRLFQPENADLSAEAARSLLAVEFAPVDLDRMHDLASRAQAGVLTEDEQQEASSYAFVGNVLGILKSKARRSLKASNGGSSPTDE